MASSQAADTTKTSSVPVKTSIPENSLFRVKLRRGLIGLPAHYREHVRALGLRHTHQKSYLEINPQVLGNVLKVKELVEVKLVKGRPASKASYWAKGYSLIKRALP